MNIFSLAHYRLYGNALEWAPRRASSRTDYPTAPPRASRPSLTPLRPPPDRVFELVQLLVVDPELAHRGREVEQVLAVGP